MSNMKIATILIGGALLALAAGAAPADEGKQQEAREGALSIKSQDAVIFVPVSAVTAQVAWATAPIQVDGDFSDWEANAIEPLVFAGAEHITWNGAAYGGKEDLSAKLRLCRDDAFLYVAIEVTDDKAPSPSQIEIGLAPANSPLITTWRDVGMRYGVDDVHAIFKIGDDTAALIWAHVQTRMDSELIANAFGTEVERRAFIEQGEPDATGGKIFSKVSRKKEGGQTTTFFEAAFPWRMLLPYDPVSYSPLNFNFAVRDSDAGANGGRGFVGWKPGLVGTYSAAHFATLAFTPPAGRDGVDAYAQLPRFHYLNENIPAAFSFFNHAAAELKGKLELFEADAKATNVIASAEVVLPKGYSRKDLSVHSEKLGKTTCGLRADLKIEGRPTQVIAVHAPTLDGSITIQPVQEVLDAITGIEANAATLSNLYAQVQAKGLDTTYPLAYWTLQQMFIARCKNDLRSGESQLVLDNAAYLTNLFIQHKARMEELLQNPESQLKVPVRPLPETLKIKKGFYYDGNKPVFLWGPCVFWWMRGDQHYAWKLGYNSVGPELPVHNEKEHPAIATYLENFRTNGMLVNASIGSADFNALKNEHPDVANVDRNNFMPVIIQHPLVREEIRKRFEKDIGFLKPFAGIRSYWLWNEPDYVNFSEMTRLDFITYLRPKYKTIEKLNVQWKSDYKTFEEVQIARGFKAENPAPWVDYQAFLNDLLVDFFGFLNRTSKGIDPSRPTHVKYMCISLASFDIERLQGITDICGHDGNFFDRDIIFLDFCRSLYPDKPLANTEIHIWYKDYFYTSLVPWRLALHGLADGNWWCWHANHRFSKTVGSAESMHALTIPALDIRRLFDPYIHALVTKPQQVATLFQDVTAGRSWGLIDKLRNEIGPAQYSLGFQPFYATETTIAGGVLKKHKILIATEASYVKDATYAAVLKYAKKGGTVIVLPQSFGANEYGVARDTSALIPVEGGEPYGENVRKIKLGRGQVICIDSFDGPDSEAKPAGNLHQGVYRRVLYRAFGEAGLLDPVRLRPPVANPDALLGWDIRTAKVGSGIVLCALPIGRDKLDELTLETDRPVKRIVNLITEKEVPIEDFKLDLAANLFLIELE